MGNVDIIDDMENDNNLNEDWQNAEDMQFGNVSPIYSDKEEVENEKNKPLKRRFCSNRKRKRSAMDLDHEPFQEIVDNSDHKKVRRKLNDGTAQNQSFIIRSTPKNIQRAFSRTNPCDSFISDLFAASKEKQKQENKENNPFSTKIERKSLAMLNTNKPNDVHSESEDEEDDDVRTPHRYLLEDSVHCDNDKNRNQGSMDYDFYDIHDEEEELNDHGIYSQLSQSQSEKQLKDIMDSLQSQTQSQRSDEMKEQQRE